MAQPRLAARPPVRCSGCFGQYPDRTHIDFASAWEGPPLDMSNPRSPRIEWLVLCENCIRNAANLLPETRTLIDELRTKAQAGAEAAAASRAYSEQLEAALAAREKVPAPPADAPQSKASKSEVASAGENGRRPRYARRGA